MNREEALTRLRLRSHQAFCEYVENGNQENEEAALDVLAYDMAIDALRPQLDENGLARCDWCGPERTGWFSVQFWVRACYGKRKWMSVTQDWKKKVKYCPMCGRNLSEVECSELGHEIGYLEERARDRG